MRISRARDLYVRAGGLVEPAWNRVIDFGNSLRIYSGPGILLADRLGGGVTISARPFIKGFDHPWRATLAGQLANFEPGLINGIEPTIDKIPMSGKDGGPRPSLRLSESLFDATGRSWLALEATVNDEAKFTSARIVQVARLGPVEGLQYADGGSPEIRPGVALDPLAVLFRGAEKKGLGTLRQVRFFPITHRVNRSNPGGPRHFFA